METGASPRPGSLSSQNQHLNGTYPPQPRPRAQRHPGRHSLPSSQPTHSFPYPPAQGNILQNLPLTSASAVVVRVAYALVCATSYPLTLVPVAGMIKPVIASLCGSGGRRTHQPLRDAEVGEGKGREASGGGGGGGGGEGSGGGEGGRGGGGEEESVWERIAMRSSLVVLTTITALCIPQFDFIVAIGDVLFPMGPGTDPTLTLTPH